MIMEAESLSESRNKREEDSKSRQKVQRETELIGNAKDRVNWRTV